MSKHLKAFAPKKAIKKGFEFAKKFTDPRQFTNPKKYWKNIRDFGKKEFKRIWANPIGRVVVTALAIYYGGVLLGKLAGGASAGGEIIAGGAGDTFLGAAGGVGTDVIAEGAGASFLSAPAINPSATWTTGGVPGSTSGAQAAGGGLVGDTGADSLTNVIDDPSLVPDVSRTGTDQAINYNVLDDPSLVPKVSGRSATDQAINYAIEQGGNKSSFLGNLSKYGGKTLDVLKDYQLPIALAVQGIAGGQQAQYQEELAEEERERRRRNMMIEGVYLPEPSGRPLTRLSTGQPLYNGFAGGRMG